jgi:tetratricopeptide (TPR) repeat protein
MPAKKRIITFSVSPMHKSQDAPAKANNATTMRKAAAHLQAGELEQARQLARAVLDAQPQHFDALHLLGVIAGLEENPAESVELISKALTLKPNATAYANRGAARLVLKHYAKALADADKAIALAPQMAVAHCVRGHALTGLTRIEDAFSSYDAAVALNPDYDEAWHHRGNASMSLGRLQNAMNSYDRALAINPKNFGGLGNQSMCYLLAGDFNRGWDRYEARWKALEAGFVAPPGSDMRMLTPENFGKPLWDGTPTRGTVLVWPEQGIGDQIIFCSMLEDLQQRVGKVVLALDERLHPLFARSFPECEIITREAARSPNNFDFQIPMGGLGAHFRRSISSCIQNRRAFLKADTTRSARLRKALNPGNQRLCGLSWSSIHPEFGDDKSMPLATLRPLLETPGFRFVDLQYGDTSAARAALKKDTGIDITHLDEIDLTKDIDGLAALIDACDVIVTISNTTAHIAGALGKPVWLMLPQNMGRFWYWQFDRDDTLWYPHVRVIRQENAGEWTDVIERVTAELAAPTATESPARVAPASKPSARKKPAAK